MGKYTLKGGQALDERLDKDFARIAEPFRATPGFLGMALMGGYGRGEGTPLVVDGETRPFNDYDLIVVGEDREVLNQTIARWSERFNVQMGVTVDLYAHTPASLKRAEPSLLNYELRWGHRVLEGPSDLLDAMPRWKWEQISPEEGTRLLLNRGALLLMTLKNRESWLAEEPLRVVNALMKNALAFGDAALMAAGQYDIHYENKRAKVEALKEMPGLLGWPWFRERYLEAVAFKEWANPASFTSEDLWKRVEQMVPHFREFFLWYEEWRWKEKGLSAENYVDRAAQSPWSLKSLYREGRLLGMNAARPSWRWLGVHPRVRLFASLLFLLEGRTAYSALPALLGCREKENPIEAFFRLWRKLG